MSHLPCIWSAKISIPQLHLSASPPLLPGILCCACCSLPPCVPRCAHLPEDLPHGVLVLSGLDCHSVDGLVQVVPNVHVEHEHGAGVP